LQQYCKISVAILQNLVFYIKKISILANANNNPENTCKQSLLMKIKIPVLIFVLLFSGNYILIAQCYGVVNFDQAVSANGTSSFDISTTYCNELIMISYDGWAGPGTGPVTVDGNNATLINTSNSGNGTAETYAYFSPTAGTHTIVCTETGYTTLGTTAYDLNFACDFYATGTSNLLSVASLTSAETFTACNVGGPISDNITTTIPNSMIYSNVLYNDAVSSADAITWTGATFLDDYHIGYGIEGSDAYTSAGIAGTYSVTAMNSFANTTVGCGGLSMVLVAIPPPLCSIALTATSTQVNPTCGNSNGSIDITASGGVSPLTYTWSPIVSTLANATGLSVGSYTVIISDAACPPETTTLVITLAGPVITLTANITANEKCNGDCIGSANVSIAGGVSPYTYAWAPSGGITATAGNLCAGTYTITVTDNNGCANSVSATITQPALLSGTTTQVNPLCNGGTGSISINAVGGTSPYNYQWSPSGQTGSTAAGLAAGIYTVTVTDINGCTTSVSGEITQPSALTDSITGPLMLCLNGTGSLTVSVSGGTSPYLYAWNTGGASSTLPITLTATQTYSVTITDVNGCTSSTDITVSLEGPPTVTVSSPETSICAGTTTVLLASAVNATSTFTWQPGSITGPVIAVTPAGTTTYSVSVTGTCGTAMSSITIVVNQPPVTLFSADITSGCPPLCMQFKDESSSVSGKIIEWQWNFGNGDTSSLENPIYCYPKPGNYSVDLLAVTDSGCSSTLHLVNYVDVYSLPVANFTTTPLPASILQSTIQFTNESTSDCGIVAWSWNFGDAGDSSSGILNPVHTYLDTGTYCPSLIVTDQHGCVDTATNCFTIDPVFSFYIPGAFSPNGDGVNDVFEATGSDVKSFEMYIFNRWGTQLFHSTSIKDGWNGMVNNTGIICQEDTYVYMVNAYDNKNQKHSFTGTVTLIK
jgi:gliding motility-associated-like protein